MTTKRIKPVRARSGTRLLYTLKAGEKFALLNPKKFRGVAVVVHPDHPPKIIMSDGSQKELRIAPHKRKKK